MKINRYVLIFSGLLSILTASYFFVFMKFFPVLAHETLYYCREMAKALTFNLTHNYGTVFFGILLVSVLYSAFRLLTIIVRAYKFRQTLSRYTAGDCELNLSDEVVILREIKPLAFCFGILNPKIYISSGLIELANTKELEIVLRHEKYHLEHRDNLTSLFVTFIESLFPFFPVLKDLVRIYKTDRELLADMAAIKTESDKHFLSSILKKLLRYEPVTIPAFASAIADADTLETRIKSLLLIKVEYRKLKKINLIYSSIFAAMLSTLMVTPIRSQEFHSKNLDAVVVCNQEFSSRS